MKTLFIYLTVTAAALWLAVDHIAGAATGAIARAAAGL